ncbi:MAG: hypothetical protein KDD00_04930 [Ignavibacteriae bacterium]|nr:hypothetical protein [Ignavibacteriota bacterium]
MKKFASIFLLLFTVVFYSSCGSDSNDTSGGLLGPGSGSNSISYSISGTGDPTNYTFRATPSVDTKITRVIASAPAFNFADTITADPNETFVGGTAYEIGNYTGVEAGQAWVFTFTGTVVSNNEAYTVTSNFTVPN